MPWTPTAAALAAATQFTSNLADVGITVASGYGPKAMFDSFALQLGADPHAAQITWSLGVTSGKYSSGLAAPNATFGSVTGCDKGVTITMTTGLNTSTGPLWNLYYGTGYNIPPAVTVQAADAATAAVMFTTQMYATSTGSGFQLNTASPLANATYSWHCLTNGVG
jgi:hypothetical protein